MLPGRTVRILSIDGGGIRGIIPALLLHHIKQNLEARGQEKPFARIFDLVAGTSTGGLIALGLTAPNTETPPASTLLSWLTRRRPEPKLGIMNLVDFYRKQGESIFPSRGFHRWRNLAQAFTEKYDTQALETIARDILGDLTLRQTLCPVLITAYDTTRMSMQLFRTTKARIDKKENFYLRDVLRATSAAPTYFEPHQLSPVDRPDLEYTMVDGAVFANNPALLAYYEAKRIFPLAKRFVIVSLGTGRQQRSYEYDQMQRWGFIDWINPLKGVPLLTMMNSAQNQLATYQLDRARDVDYIRLDRALEGCSARIDDASPRNIECLEEFVEKIIASSEPELTRIINLLKRA